MWRTLYCLWITVYIQTFFTYAQFPFPFFFPRPMSPFVQRPVSPFFPGGNNRVFRPRATLSPGAFQRQRFVAQNQGGFASQGSNQFENLDLSRMPDFSSNSGLAAGNRLINQISSAPSANTQRQFQPNRFQGVQSQIQNFRANTQLRNRNIRQGFLPQQGRTQITFPPQPPVTQQQQRRVQTNVNPTQGGQLNFARFPQNPFELANFPRQFNMPTGPQQPVFQPQGVLQFPRPTQQQRRGQQQVIPTAAAAARQTIQQARMQSTFASQTARQNVVPPGFPSPGFPSSPMQQPSFGAPSRGNLVPPAAQMPSQIGSIPGQPQTQPQNPTLPQLPRLPTRQFPPPQQQQSLQGLQNLVNPASQQTSTNTGLQSFQPFPSSAQTEVQSFPPLPSATQTGSSGGLAGLTQSQSGSSSTSAGSPDSLFPESEALKALGIDPSHLDPNTFRTSGTAGSGSSGATSGGSAQSQTGTGTVIGPDGQELTTVDPNNIPPGAEVQTLVTIMDDHGNLLYQGVGLSPEEIDKIANEIAQNLTRGNPAGSPPVGIVDTGTVGQPGSSSSSGGLSQIADPSLSNPPFPDNPQPPPLPSLSDISQSSGLRDSQSSIIGGSQTFAGGSSQQQGSPAFPSRTVVDFANPTARSSQTASAWDAIPPWFRGRDGGILRESLFPTTRQTTPSFERFSPFPTRRNSERLFEQFLNNPDQFASAG